MPRVHATAPGRRCLSLPDPPARPGRAQAGIGGPLWIAGRAWADSAHPAPAGRIALPDLRPESGMRSRAGSRAIVAAPAGCRGQHHAICKRSHAPGRPTGACTPLPPAAAGLPARRSCIASCLAPRRRGEMPWSCPASASARGSGVACAWRRGGGGNAMVLPGRTPRGSRPGCAGRSVSALPPFSPPCGLGRPAWAACRPECQQCPARSDHIGHDGTAAVR